MGNIFLVNSGGLTPFPIFQFSPAQFFLGLNLGVKKAALRAKMGYILGSYPVISVGCLGPTPKGGGEWGGEIQ